MFNVLLYKIFYLDFCFCFQFFSGFGKLYKIIETHSKYYFTDPETHENAKCYFTDPETHENSKCYSTDPETHENLKCYFTDPAFRFERSSSSRPSSDL